MTKIIKQQDRIQLLAVQSNIICIHYISDATNCKNFTNNISKERILKTQDFFPLFDCMFDYTQFTLQQSLVSNKQKCLTKDLELVKHIILFTCFKKFWTSLKQGISNLWLILPDQVTYYAGRGAIYSLVHATVFCSWDHQAKTCDGIDWSDQTLLTLSGQGISPSKYHGNFGSAWK